jgi:Recombinase
MNGRRSLRGRVEAKSIGLNRMCQPAFRSPVRLSICQEKRRGGSLLCGDRSGSRSSPRGFRALYQRTLEHRNNRAIPQRPGVSTRFNRGPWERSTIWRMLRNPAYQGTGVYTGVTLAIPPPLGRTDMETLCPSVQSSGQAVRDELTSSAPSAQVRPQATGALAACCLWYTGIGR